MKIRNGCLSIWMTLAPNARKPLQCGVSLGAGFTLSVDEAGGLALWRYAQCLGGVVAQGIEAKDEFRQQFHHVVDLFPTLLEVTGITLPRRVNGIAQDPARLQHGAYLHRCLGPQRAYHPIF